MSYLVMECRQSHVVVLDSQGRFLKAANLGYEVGQELDRVVELREPEREQARPRWRKQLAVWGTLAACLCLFFAGSWQMLLTPQGTVRMQINPDVMMWVNRMNYVVRLEGLNEDGQILTQGVSTFGKKMEVLSDELADRAMELGYLDEGGEITLTVESENEEWKRATQELLVLELEVRLPQTVQITAAPEGDSPEPQKPEQNVVIPASRDDQDDLDDDEDDAMDDQDDWDDDEDDAMDDQDDEDDAADGQEDREDSDDQDDDRDEEQDGDGEDEDSDD